MPSPVDFCNSRCGNSEADFSALVRILEHDDSPTLTSGQSEGRTAEDGSVSLNPELIFTATMKPFYRSGWIRYWDKRLMVVADGFQPISVQLEDHAGQGHTPARSTPPANDNRDETKATGGEVG